MTHHSPTDHLEWSSRCTIGHLKPPINMLRLLLLIVGSVLLGGLLALLVSSVLVRVSTSDTADVELVPFIRILPPNSFPSCQDCNSLRRAEI